MSSSPQKVHSTMAWLEPGPKEDNEEEISTMSSAIKVGLQEDKAPRLSSNLQDSMTKAMMQAMVIDDIDVKRLQQSHGNQFHVKGMQAEAWIQQPPHDMWPYEHGQDLIAHLGDATKPSEEKYYTALLIFKDIIEQAKVSDDTDQELRAKTDPPPRLKPSSDVQVSNPAKWLSSATTAFSTVKEPRDMTIEELTKENERLKHINLEMKNTQLQMENEKLKQRLEESNRMGGSWPQAMGGSWPQAMGPQSPFGPYGWPWMGMPSSAPPVPAPGFQFPDGKTVFEVPMVNTLNSQESQSSGSGYSTSYPGSFGSSSFGSSYGTHVEQDQSLKSSANMALHSVPPEKMTTVMMRNIPNNYSREQVIELLVNKGYAKTFDLLYLPIDFEKRNGLGYAFINFTTHETAQEFCEKLRGFDDWDANSDKKCDVNWSSLLQGLPAHIERYRNSPVMHESVPDEFKPMLFKDGERTVFPEPTKKIRPPQQWRH